MVDLANDPACQRHNVVPTLSATTRGVVIAPSGYWRKLLAFSGPGYLVAVGYMDPGNWATDLAGGSGYGYTLLSVVLLSSIIAMVLQALSAKLGIVSGLDLAQACRASYPPSVARALWVLCEVAICACDLAEVIGTAIALNLLFGLPMLAGVLLTVLDVLLVLLLQRNGMRQLEVLVIGMLVLIGTCFVIELGLAELRLRQIAAGFVPDLRIVSDPEMLFVAIGILGATVMPHNLYLHSALVQTRRVELAQEGRREAIRFATIDSSVALTFAFVINASILILAAAVFHGEGTKLVTDLREAYELLGPLLGLPLAATVFAVALLASGQNATLTATLAGQVVMEGFLELRLAPWARRLVTRAVAIVPAIAVLAIWGSAATGKLLLITQVVLSLQLPFAVVPLVQFTGSRRLMGRFANRRWLQVLAVAIAVALVGLNGKLVFDMVT